MSAAHTPMVVAAARVLCNRMADACEIDREDAWKTYGDDYLEDAKAALDAAAATDLFDALADLVANQDATWVAAGFTDEQIKAMPYLMPARAVIAKAGGAA